MKSLKKWLLILTLAGPTVTNFSCTSMLMRQMFDAALVGAGAFVEEATFNFLDQNVTLGDE